MRKIIIFITALCAIAQCSHSQEPFKRSLRLISLAPATTEIVFALGSGNELVGVSQFCDYPADVTKIARVGTFSQPNIEKILALKPDIIVCTGLEQAPVISKLRQLGLYVYVSDPNNFIELYRSISEIAGLVDKNSQAAALILRIKSQVAEAVRKSRRIPYERRPKVFVELWHGPLMTAGKGSFLDEIISMAGGINIAGGSNKPYLYYSPEQVIYNDPGVIFLTYMQKEPNPSSVMKERFGWGGISAVKNNRIFNDINPDLLLRAGPRITEGLRLMQERLLGR